MILILHISIALASVVSSTYALIYPSRNKLNLSYALVALTIATGTYLVISLHTPLLQVCTTGLVYIGGIFLVLLSAHKRLANSKAGI